MTDDWLSIDEITGGKTATNSPIRRKRRKKSRKRAKGPALEAGSKLDHARDRGKPMQRRFGSRDRIWSCDGEFVYFRPFSFVGGVKTARANPTTMDRHNRALSAGHYEYVETQDDVEIYRVTAESPFARRSMYLGEMRDGDVRRQVAIAACKRDWTLYVDALEELFGRIKNRGYDPGMETRVREDMLNYIGILIQMRGGPTPAECGAGLQGVRAKRGEGRGRVVLTSTRI